VGRVETREHVDRDRGGDPWRHRASAERRVRVAHQASKRLARDVLHHEQDLVRAHDDIERRDHVRVDDPPDQPRLVEEHRADIGVGRDVRVHPLDRDRAGEAMSPDELAEVHRRHSAARELCEQLVALARRTGGSLRHW
jgi:hypothetical protein